MAAPARHLLFNGALGGDGATACVSLSEEEANKAPSSQPWIVGDEEDDREQGRVKGKPFLVISCSPSHPLVTCFNLSSFAKKN